VKNLTKAIALSSSLVLAGGLQAEPFTEAEIEASFYPYNDWTPTFEGYEPGVTINQANVEQFKPILDEALYRFIKDGWVEIETHATSDFPLSDDYVNATRKYSEPVTVNEKGKMVRTKVVSVRNGKVVPGGKGKFDDTGTRVPLIANWPGHIKPGTVVDDMVDLTDNLPTLAEVAGLEDDGVPRDGISFAPVLLGSPDRSRQRPWIYTELRGKRCVRSPEWKLYGDGRFFDLKNDPAESSPLDTEELADQAARKHAELSEALANLKGPLPGQE